MNSCLPFFSGSNCAELAAVVVLMMVMVAVRDEVVVSGEGRRHCDKQQNSGEQGNPRFLQRNSSNEAPLAGAHIPSNTLLDCFPRTKV